MNWKFLFVVILVLSYLYGCSKDDTTGPTANNTSSVTIGTQVWMAKNLNVDRYRDGTIIPQVTDPKIWGELTTVAWCYYDNDPSNGAIFGKLYNWYAVNDQRGLAPKGWHVLGEYEWTILIDYLGGVNYAGGKMKSTGTKESDNGLWFTPNAAATNESGFSALPGGYWLPSEFHEYRLHSRFLVN